MEIKLFVPGQIKGKARARTFYDPRLGKHRSITPQQTANYENWVRTCYMNEVRLIREPHPFFNDEALSVRIHAYFNIPQNFNKEKKRKAKEGKLHPTKKPDADNIAKIICDALNGFAYKDDKQIAELTVIKKYNPSEESAEFCMIEIKEI